MPELPEVETVKRGLAPVMEGVRIDTVLIHRYDLRFPIPDNFSDIVMGQTIKTIERRAKYLLFNLENGWSVLGHLGMSGRMTHLPSAEYEFKKHDHVEWKMADEKSFVFHDPRRFGMMLLCETSQTEEHKLLVKLGPEPLENAFSTNYLKAALKNRKSAIKLAIMDSHIVVGVGNIYASEALFRTGIHPETLAGKVSKPKLEKLIASIKQVLAEAITSGGSTLRDYVRSSGDIGYFQHRFAVYGREGEPCVTCKTSITKIVQAKRSTFFCKKCQK